VIDDAIAACAIVLPALSKIMEAAPSAKFRVAGMKVAREPHRYSGRTAMRANISVHEPRQPQDVDNPMTFSMEGYNGIGKAERPAALLPYAWAPGWNSPSAWNKFQTEVGGHMRGGDAGVHVFASGNGQATYFKNVPAAFAPSANGLRALVLHRHFGEEELSSRAKPIQDRAAPVTVVFNAADAKRLGINGKATITIDGVSVTLPTQLSNTLPLGVVGLPAGLSELAVIGTQSIAQVSGGH
jgi:NADH-quinone oxidoreductase subunit G